MTLPVRLIALLAILTVACDSGLPMSDTPTGPSAMSPRSDVDGMGAMAGMGMGMIAGEFDYLTRMIPHHEEAIATAHLLQSGTERPEMRSFAATIIAAQTSEVRQMREWLAAWYQGRDTRVSYQPMMRDLVGLQGAALDRAFLEDMIPHHMMAVMMSQQLLASGLAAHASLVPFAANIRDTQRREIQMMSVWLHDWFGAAAGMH